MPLQETVYIVNNSGKIISSGKQLFSIFKEAKASYDEKKAQIKAERGLQRAQTFGVSTRSVAHRLEDYEEDEDRERRHRHRSREIEDHKSRRRSLDGASDTGSRRSHRHKSSHSQSQSKHGGTINNTRSIKAPPTVALTERNLKAASEASSVRPSRPPVAMQYRSPYAETLPVDQSRMDLARSIDPRMTATAVATRRRSESELGLTVKKKKEIDMNLAYGEIPPDLASRTDLDPELKEQSAKSIVKRIEGLLDEANCVQHSAGAMIKHLQEKPEAAAAVAFSLAELSKLVTKMSPVLLGFLQGGSPAVFALLASPQFLIGTGLAVGVTVVMFGGWKMIKQIKEAQSAREALAWEGAGAVPQNRPVPMRTQSAYAGSYDEALVLDEELSVIESWRRGIEQPLGDNESADLELITPEADRATRLGAMTNRDEDFDVQSRRSGKTHQTHQTHQTWKTAKTNHKDEDEFDIQSRRSTKTHRTSKTAKTSKTSKTSKTTKTNKTEKLHKSHKSRLYDDEIPERSSSKFSVVNERVRPASEFGKSPRSSGRSEMRYIEDGRAQRARDDLDLVMRPRVERSNTDLLKSLFKGKKDKSRSELVLA